jgi:thiol-disulfide isomerase/thioredoxin/YHS domain-containing protein
VGDGRSLAGKIGKSSASRQFSHGFVLAFPISRRRKDAESFSSQPGFQGTDKMLRHWSIGVALAVWGLLSSAQAQQPIRWQWDLVSAQQLAGRTNRLVLVHFWADWCGPCKRMDQDVFSRSDVAAALEADYVAVKLHKDHFPAMAQKFGVTAIPADVILTPQGQVLEKFQGYSEASQYVGRMNRVAAVYRTQNGRVYTQIAGQPSQTPVAAPTGGPQYSTPGYPPQAGAQGYPDNRSVDPFNRSPQAATAPANPPYAGAPLPERNGPRPDAAVGPQLNMNAPGQPSMVQSDPMRSPYPQNPAPVLDPLLPQQGPAMSPMAPATPPRDQANPYLGAGIQPSRGAPQGTVAAPPNQGGQPWQAMPSPSPSAMGAPAAEAMPSRSVELPPGNPPLGLDGYCPVQLNEKERWVRGNSRWGVRHEGRTYLFAGPEEQSRFYADPDRYAPVLSGDDVVLMVEQGQRVAGRREHGGWFQNRIYLFADEATFQRFFADPYRYANAVTQMKSSVAARPGSDQPPAGSRPTGPGWGTPNPAGPAQYR